ncbi:caspase activity and apoptosis inhibitor 1 isoform X2 [Electrophorus electricus]|uniref:caspase activity and apoptosis inhibitor 1 isoform X2 n=1 Tax=Electrophorus electricus TaxID=8005 RepID=UPI0015D08875|nr:caspase activity and apoptosis inhibitor 1 isoform X2 [Electrophorus electricus]
MQGKKSSKEKKRKHAHRDPSDGDGKRRSTESSVEDRKGEAENAGQATAAPSDVEEGGLDLSVPLKPIGAYAADRHEMLEQCFRVLGESKLRKMLPDELKDSSFAEIRTLCWDQLQQLSESNLLQILEGEELTANSETKETAAKRNSAESQQDNNVDSTSSVKEATEAEDKQGGSGDDSDVLSINADMDDSDIEGHKDNKPLEEEVPTTMATNPPVAAPAHEPGSQSAEPKLELQHDIDKSVSEILALTTPTSSKLEGLLQPVAIETAPTSLPLPAATTAVPSAQQLALLELEMRARAIKALMKANEHKK